MSDDRIRFCDTLSRHLDWFAERDLKARFWWRDDDAIEPTPALERLLSLADTHKVEVALAVIPKHATQALADRLQQTDYAVVLQHGYQHQNFQRKDLGEKAAELGSRRDPAEVYEQLKIGKARLAEMFGEKFIPALVPPWNRVSPAVRHLLPRLGLQGLSTFTWDHFPRAHQLQTHVDIIKWKKDRKFIGWESARLRFDLQMMRRRTNPTEAIGLLTHHLAQQDDCFEFLEVFFDIAAHHPGAEWPSVRSLFEEAF